MVDRTNFFDDQHVHREDLNQLASYSIDQDIRRAQGILGDSGGIYGSTSYASGSVSHGGVLGAPTDYLTNVNLRAVAQSTTSIRVYPGSAIDSVGNLITLAAYVDVTLSDNLTNKVWTVSAGVLNYIKLQFLEIANTYGSDDLGNSYPTRYTPSYKIVINSVIPAAGDILLGTFIADGGGAVTGTITDRRLYVRIITTGDAVYLDPTTIPVTSHLTVRDHVNAVGTGTPTVTNPHGLSASDLDISDLTSSHRKETHTSGIVAKSGVYDAAVYNSWTPSYTDTGAEVIIEFTPPDADAAILSGGISYTAALDTVSLLDTSLFTAGNGNYYLYINSSGSMAADSGVPVAATYNDPSRYVLCSFNRADGGSSISSFVDQRRFISISEYQIRADFEEGNSSPALTLAKTATLKDTLDRMRYMIGRALSGNGAFWNLANPPLTSGGTTNADAYHMHTRTSAATYIINYDAATGDLEDMAIKMYRGASDGYASLYWENASKVFQLYSTEFTTYADLWVNDLKARGGTVEFDSSTTAPVALKYTAAHGFDFFTNSILETYSDVYVGAQFSTSLYTGSRLFTIDYNAEAGDTNLRRGIRFMVNNASAADLVYFNGTSNDQGFYLYATQPESYDTPVPASGALAELYVSGIHSDIYYNLGNTLFGTGSVADSGVAAIGTTTVTVDNADDRPMFLTAFLNSATGAGIAAGDINYIVAGIYLTASGVGTSVPYIANGVTAAEDSMPYCGVSLVVPKGCSSKLEFIVVGVNSSYMIRKIV